MFQKIVIKALTQKRKVLVVRKIARTIKDSTFQMTLDTLQKLQLYSLCKVNKSDFSIMLPNDSVILFKGVDNDAERIKSITGLTDIVIEEATELTLEEFIQLDLRLRANAPNLQIYLAFNPVSKVNWCYKHWFSGETPADTFILKTTYKDNRFLPQEYIKALELTKKTNPTYYNIYALGEFCSLDKLIYNNWTIGETEPKGELIIGLDFGYVNDATALIAAYLDEDEKKIYIVDEYYKTGMLNDAIADMIKYKGYAKEVIIADSAEQKSIEEIRRQGIIRIKPAVKGQGSILQGIQKLQQYEIVVNPKCAATITELQNYSWTKDKQSNEYINKPIDSYNHCLDALRYALQCLDNKQKIQTINKAILGL